MPFEFPSYPKIYNLGHAALTSPGNGLFDGQQVVQEKVDGSQFSFALTEDGLRCRSKGSEILLDAPKKMFGAAVETVRALESKLPLGTVFRGEYLQKPKHNVLAYDRVPKGHIALFDACTAQELYMSPGSVAGWADTLGLEYVPVFEVDCSSLDTLRTLLERTSFLGGQKIEGIVVKNYARFGRDGKALMGKFVSEAFKEVHRGEWKKGNPTGRDILGILADSLTTPARWNKAVQHLRERGDLTETPKDIGPLVKEIQSDTQAECEAEIKEQLFKWAWPHISRGIIKGAPEWYKEELAKKQFGGES